MDMIIADMIDRLVSDLHYYRGELYYMKDCLLKDELQHKLEALSDWLEEKRN